MNLLSRSAWQRGVLRLVCLVSLVVPAARATGQSDPARMPPMSLDALQQSRFASAWTSVRPLPDGPGFAARLIAYRSSGLLVHAMVATPAGPAPAPGFPVLVANHGFHPNPPRYGITATGVDLRPGDYYRPIPALYTQAGFIVVMPDYRGHNASEGLAFTTSPLAPAHYAEDVLALLSGLASLDRADLRHVFLWGHSMGGEVSVRTLLATGQAKGASVWSSTAAESWGLTGALSALRTPMVIQHAVGDSVTSHKGSVRLAEMLAALGVQHEFHSLPGNDHFFQGDQLQQAVDRDVRFFRSLMQPNPLVPSSR